MKNNVIFKLKEGDIQWNAIRLTWDNKTKEFKLRFDFYPDFSNKKNYICIKNKKIYVVVNPM